MNFLKTIKAHGFKSFANPITINFDHNLIGVVGPNGSGKSNINDAIRWVMGEQSAKQLRGNSMEDVIFNGSALKKAMNMAEVTLTFSNHNKIFSLNYNEISITRRLYRNDRGGEYLINGVRARLKDVQKLAMEAGISKSSLSIISQGTVSKLAEAKPEEFRDFLDEAAGVSKYKKHKVESLRKLARTNDNLEKINIIITELETQIKPLAKQASKASEYLKHKKDLEKIEIAFLAQEINEANLSFKKNSTEIKTLNTNKINLDALTSNFEIQINAATQSKFKIEKTIADLQNKLNDNNENLKNLEIELARQEEAQKYAIKNNQQLNVDQKIIKELEHNIKLAKKNIDSVEERIQLIEKKLSDLNSEIEISNSDQDNLTEKVNNFNRDLNILETKKHLAQDQLAQESFLFPGVKIILKHKASFDGVFDILNNLISYENQYSLVIQNCLSHNLQNIITKNSQSAKNVVAFLKRNRAGKATFIPLNDIKIRHLPDQAMIIANNTPGFINTVNNIVKIASKFQKAIDFLTNRIFVIDNLTNAIELNKRLNSQYRIVTLEGDMIFPGGTISGGFNKLKANNQQAIKHNITNLELEISNVKTNSASENKALTNLKQVNLKLKENYQEKYFVLAQLRENHKLSSINFEKLITQYETSSNNKANDLVYIKDDKSQKLSFLHKVQDQIVSDIKGQRNEGLKTAKLIQDFELKLVSSNHKTKKIMENISVFKIANNKSSLIINNNVQRLNDHYKLTFEYAFANYKLITSLEEARKNVSILIEAINKIGNVNIDAITEYAEVKSRHDHLSKNADEINKAKKEIETAIKNMDTEMLKRFSQLMIDVRVNFQKVFKIMFGGGVADLKYSDPNDPLNSGIEIIVQPPGKSIKTLTLFSGGEKSLIVISLLFAILETRHLPLVILDEAEAPLDEANVARYGKYLQNFSEHTQFIVVTHRPGTMEYLNVLYGATMPSAGITKMVSVKLKDALELAETKKMRQTKTELNN